MALYEKYLTPKTNAPFKILKELYKRAMQVLLVILELFSILTVLKCAQVIKLFRT